MFIPFPTILLGTCWGKQFASVIYGSTLALTGLMLQLIWWYATSDHHLVEMEIDPRLVQRATRRNMMGPLLYFFAVGVSFLSVEGCLVIFLLVPLFYIIPGRIDRHWKHNK